MNMRIDISRLGKLKGKRLALVLIATAMLISAGASWLVFSGLLVEITGSVQKPEATVGTINVNLGTLKAGQGFYQEVFANDIITISNADHLNGMVYLSGIDDDFASGAISNVTVGFLIFQDQNGNQTYDDGEPVAFGGEIQAPGESSTSGYIPEGTWDVLVAVYGYAGYPDSAAQVNFDVEIDLTTPS